MDGYLNSNIDIAVKMVHHDMDFVCIIDGLERAGKSVLALQLALYVDPSFNLSRVVFNSVDFKKAVTGAKKYQAVIYDEAMSGLASRTTMSYVNIMLVKALAEIGQKNLFVFIVLPSFFELDKYPAIHRSRCLLHVYMKGLRRGFFTFYDINKKRDLYLLGKKAYKYLVPANFIGRFTNYYAVDEKEYRRLKHKSLTATRNTPAEMRMKTMRDSLINWCFKDLKKEKEAIIKGIRKYCEFSLHKRSIERIVQEKLK